VTLEILQTILFVVQVLVALALIGLILMQQGKGANAGAAFGSGASATVFGAQGSGNFLTKTTTWLAFVFLANSLTLAYIATESIKSDTSLIQSESFTELLEQKIEAPLSKEMNSEISENLDNEGTISEEMLSEIPESPDKVGSEMPSITG